MRFMICLMAAVLTVGCTTSTTQTSSKRMVFPDGASQNRALETYIQLGEGYLHQRDTSNARRVFTRALSIDKNSSEAIAGMAIIYQLEQEVEKSEKFFKRALRADKANSKARNNYGAFLFAQERYNDALTELKKATADTEYDRREAAFVNLGRTYVALERFQEAEAAFTRALQLDSRNASALLNLTKLYYDSERYPEAKQHYDRYVSMAAQTPESLWMGVQIEAQYHNKSAMRQLGGLLQKHFPYSKQYLEYRRLEASL